MAAPAQLSWSRGADQGACNHVLPAGITAIVFGTLFPFGGLSEASATVVFGAYFVTALIIAFIAIRDRDVTRHRRWMIRAFAIGLAIATIRIWIVLFQVFGVLSFENSFGVAFWLSFVLHARGRGLSGEAPACADGARRLTRRQPPRAGRFSVCDRGTPSSNSFSRSISALSSAPNSSATFVSHSQATSTMAPANVP
jgi:hypothetical protein